MVSNKTLLPVVCFSVASVIAIALVATPPVLEPEATEPFRLSVEYLVAKPQDKKLIVNAQGTVEPRTEADLVPEVSGVVVEVSPALVSGGRFGRGDFLLKIDDRDYRHRLGRARAAVERAEADLQFARYEFDRLSSLKKRDLASASLAEEAERTYRTAEATLKQARIDVESAALDLERTEIRAPFSGRVRFENVDHGQFIDRGEVVARLYATDFVEVRLPLADQQLAFLDETVLNNNDMAIDSPSVRVSAKLAGQQQYWDGKLDRTEGEIDQSSRMIHVVARIANDRADNKPPLPVGLFVNAEIEGRLVRDVFTLPRVSIRDNNRVLILDEENRLHFRDVHILRIESELVIVDQGIANGDRICISQLQAVVENMPVQASESNWGN